MKRFKLCLAALFLTCFIGGTAQMIAQDLPSRDKIADQYKWNLTDFYKTDADWDADYAWVESQIPQFKQYEGKFTTSAKLMVEFLDFNMKVQKKYSALAFYAYAAKDIDLANGKYVAMINRLGKLGSEMSAMSAYMVPEILEMNEAKLKEFIKSEKGLKQYEFMLIDTYRQKKHSLSKDQERLLAQLSPTSDVPEEIYGVLNDSELPFQTIKDPDGKDFKLSHGRYRASLYDQNRDFRRDVYKGTYVPYDQLKKTFASIYNGRVKQRIANGIMRNYSSALESYLEPNNIPVSVYENLIKTTHENLKTQHRWAAIKKRVLKLNELHPYDTYVSLFPSVQKAYTYDEAKEICLDALKPMGEEYLNNLRRCLNNRWVDVYETENKRSGAYSNGCGCGFHPIVLLNWNNTLDDVFTLVHELGHNMHSYYTEAAQPYHYSNYSTFVAEVASTTNEALLSDYMIKNAKTPTEKAALIEHFLTNVQTTFFRQAEFADFEKTVHERAEKGEFLSPDQLTKLFADQYQQYWGPDMVVDAEEGLSWARIPHFYHYNFYVFQYATGFSAAQALSSKIENEGKPAVEKYFGFLRTGSSDYSIEMLKNAGVDMSTPAPILEMLKKANKYLDELEEILNQQK
jgi:oligoendopeptidase F